MKTIRLGDPQPSACKHCGEFAGYQVCDNIRGQYISIFTAEGAEDGGSYSDSQTTTKIGTRAQCANCGHDLKLKVDRTDF